MTAKLELPRIAHIRKFWTTSWTCPRCKGKTRVDRPLPLTRSTQSSCIRVVTAVEVQERSLRSRRSEVCPTPTTMVECLVRVTRALLTRINQVDLKEAIRAMQEAASQTRSIQHQPTVIEAVPTATESRWDEPSTSTRRCDSLSMVPREESSHFWTTWYLAARPIWEAWALKASLWRAPRTRQLQTYSSKATKMTSNSPRQPTLVLVH